MRFLLDIPTRGDNMTQAGGIVMRYSASKGEYIVHNYNNANGGASMECFQGGYHSKLSDALTDMARRVARAEQYDTGGSIDNEKFEADMKEFR
jgi:hypothetical protein